MEPTRIIEQNLEAVRREIQAACQRCGRDFRDVTLIAVTKTVEWPHIRTLYGLGVRDFGESRPQALWDKCPKLPDDARWHLIGHLQTNKVRRTLPLVYSVHSVDRWNLAEAISNEAQRLGHFVNVALQVNLTGEQSKQGFTKSQLLDVYSKIVQLPSLNVTGLMTMARYEEESERCRPTFAALRELRDELRAQFTQGPELPMLSMGMSNDFTIAIEEGATHVRVGSALFEGLQDQTDD